MKCEQEAEYMHLEVWEDVQASSGGGPVDHFYQILGI